MKVSVIIPHYNRYEKLIKLINTIPSDREVEIIVVDDCSTNLSDIQIKTLENMEKITFIRNLENKTAGYSRNLGLEKAKGEYVIFADSDDFFIEENFNEIYKLIEDNDNDIIFFPPVGKSEIEGKKTKRGKKISKYVYSYYKRRNFKNEMMLRYSFQVPWSKLYKKSFIKKHNIKFDEIKVSNDVMFSTKTGYYAEKIKAHNVPIYVSVKSKDSLTRTINHEILNIRLRVHLEYLGYLSEKLTKKEMKFFKRSKLNYIYRRYKQNFKLSSITRAYKDIKSLNKNKKK